MKLMTVDEYINIRYANNSRPHKRTIIRHILMGVLPGKKIGKFYYVDIANEQRMTGNPLVDRVLVNH